MNCDEHKRHFQVECYIAVVADNQAAVGEDRLNPEAVDVGRTPVEL